MFEQRKKELMRDGKSADAPRDQTLRLAVEALTMTRLTAREIDTIVDGRDPIFDPRPGDVVRSEYPSIGERRVVHVNDCGRALLAHPPQWGSIRRLLPSWHLDEVVPCTSRHDR